MKILVLQFSKFFVVSLFIYLQSLNIQIGAKFLELKSGEIIFQVKLTFYDIQRAEHFIANKVWDIFR